MRNRSNKSYIDFGNAVTEYADLEQNRYKTR